MKKLLENVETLIANRFKNVIGGNITSHRIIVGYGETEETDSKDDKYRR